jgi:hypothetical protein
MPAVSHSPAGPLEIVVPCYGNRIVLPGNLSGKKVAVSLFDIRGRLIDTRLVTSGVIVRRNAAEGIVIAKVRIVQ